MPKYFLEEVAHKFMTKNGYNEIVYDHWFLEKSYTEEDTLRQEDINYLKMLLKEKKNNLLLIDAERKKEHGKNLDKHHSSKLKRISDINNRLNKVACNVLNYDDDVILRMPYSHYLLITQCVNLIYNRMERIINHTVFKKKTGYSHLQKKIIENLEVVLKNLNNAG